MSDDTRDYLKKKAEQLRLDRGDALTDIQTELEKRYPGQVRAVSLNDGVLRLITPSSGVASELRLGQVELIKTLKLTEPQKRLAITIRDLT
jgi:hypothetical protein